MMFLTTWPITIISPLPLGQYKKIFQIATLPFCPESPKYLLLDKDDEHGAEEGLIIQHNQNESDTADVFSSTMAEGNH